MPHSNDIGAVADALSIHAQEVCRTFLSAGQRVGDEWLVGSIRNTPGNSFHVMLDGPKAGAFYDHGSEPDPVVKRGGRLLTIISYGLKQTAEDFKSAADWGRNFLGWPAFSSNGHHKPDVFDPLKQRWKPKGEEIWIKASEAWAYSTVSGEIQSYRIRFNHPTAKDPVTGKPKKFVIPWRLIDGEWKCRGWKRKDDEKTPIYNLHLLARRPSATVIVVEGEKTADAAAKLFPAYVVTTWMSGAESVGLAEWGPLIGREVILWPDNDAAGLLAMQDLQGILRDDAMADSRIVDTAGLPPKWDLADEPVPGIDIQTMLDSAGTVVKPKEPESDADLTEWLSLASEKGKTELANSKRFVKAHGENARFCYAWGRWVVWNGTYWQANGNGKAESMAKEISESMWKEIAQNSHLQHKEHLSFAKTTSKSAGVSAMLKLSESALPVEVAQFDTHPWLLTCPNGTVDLRTGKKREHRQEDFLTAHCPTRFNPDATCDHFNEFLASIFDCNSTLMDFVLRLFGYSLTGDISEQILPVFYGGGSNGKSTLLTAIKGAIGDQYTATAPPSLLMEKKFEEHPTELAVLFGKRLVTATETKQGVRLSEAQVKQLTGGDDVCTRQMRQDFWKFSPTHKLYLSTNHKPIIEGTDHAIWRRIILNPFNVQFWDEEKGETGPDHLKMDKSLPDKLKAEKEGILMALIRACLLWQKNGLGVPEIVKVATSGYKNDSDTVGKFVSDSCVTLKNLEVKCSTLYSEFERWCGETGDYVVSRKAFGIWMLEHGIEARKGNVWCYKGIAMKPQSQD